MKVVWITNHLKVNLSNITLDLSFIRMKNNNSGEGFACCYYIYECSVAHLLLVVRRPTPPALQASPSSSACLFFRL